MLTSNVCTHGTVILVIFCEISSFWLSAVKNLGGGGSKRQ